MKDRVKGILGGAVFFLSILLVFPAWGTEVIKLGFTGPLSGGAAKYGKKPTEPNNSPPCMRCMAFQDWRARWGPMRCMGVWGPCTAWDSPITLQVLVGAMRLHGTHTCILNCREDLVGSGDGSPDGCVSCGMQHCE